MFSRPVPKFRRPARPRRRTALLAVGALTSGLLLIAPAARLRRQPREEPRLRDRRHGRHAVLLGEVRLGRQRLHLLHRGRRPLRRQGHEGRADPPRRGRPQGADHRVRRVRAGRQRRQAVRPRALVQVDDPGHLAHALPARRDRRLAVLDRPQDPADQRRLGRGDGPYARGPRGHRPHHLGRLRLRHRLRDHRRLHDGPGRRPDSRTPCAPARPRSAPTAMGRAAHAEPGPLHALRRPQQRQGAADRGLRQRPRRCSRRARSPARSTTR